MPGAARCCCVAPLRCSDLTPRHVVIAGVLPCPNVIPAIGWISAIRKPQAQLVSLVGSAAGMISYWSSAGAGCVGAFDGPTATLDVWAFNAFGVWGYRGRYVVPTTISVLVPLPGMDTATVMWDASFLTEGSYGEEGRVIFLQTPASGNGVAVPNSQACSASIPPNPTTNEECGNIGYDGTATVTW